MNDEWRKKFVIQRQGKDVVLYAGLLDLAHKQGLKHIETELQRIDKNPATREIELVAVKARVEMDDDKTFTGLGDASPSNVGKMVSAHLPRMAETRAKARALRDAVNIGMVSLEELGDESEPKKVTTLKPGPPLREELPPDDDEHAFWVDQVELLLEAFGDDPPSPPRRTMRAASQGVEEAKNVVLWLRGKAAERGVLPDDSANPDNPEEY